MTTRIKYYKYNKFPPIIVSDVYINYEGRRLFVQIEADRLYIIVNSYHVLEEIPHNNINKAKRIARSLLINKYNVRLINEVRNVNSIS